MENLELRIQKLEKNYRTLKYSVFSLMCFAVYAGLSGTAVMNSSALAQQKRTMATAPKLERTPAQKEKERAGVPLVVEAEVFLLKDADGNIRGVWTADDTTTSFAMMHKEKYPIIAMAIDKKNASMSLTDVYGGKINFGLNDSIRSISIMDNSKKNSIYLGLTGKGAAAFDMVSVDNAAVTIDGAASSIDMSGDTSIIALTETVGSAIALKAQASSSILTFLDYQNKPMTTLSSIDGVTQLYMSSPATKDEKTIGTMSDEQLAFTQNANRKPEAAADKKAQETPEAAAAATVAATESPQTEEKNKVLNMKTYSPFEK